MPTYRQFRVLTVSSDGTNLELVRDQLKQLGCTVTAIDSGAVAAATFHAGLFDLVVTDRTLELMNGTELAAIVKRVDPAVPVIMITGGGEEIEKPASVDVLLHRPIELADLQWAIEQAITVAE